MEANYQPNEAIAAYHGVKEESNCDDSAVSEAESPYVSNNLEWLWRWTKATCIESKLEKWTSQALNLVHSDNRFEHKILEFSEMEQDH